MSWEDFISHVLTTTTKVDKMIIYDMRGRPVAVTEGVETSDTEGMALVNCLMDPAKTMTKLDISNDMFLCIQGIDNTFIGTCTRSQSTVVVAHQDHEHVIVMIGETAGRGSFIFELKQSLLLKAQGRLLSQQQLEQHQHMVPVDPAAVVIEAAAAAGRPESELIDLMS